MCLQGEGKSEFRVGDSLILFSVPDSKEVGEAAIRHDGDVGRENKVHWK